MYTWQKNLENLHFSTRKSEKQKGFVLRKEHILSIGKHLLLNNDKSKQLVQLIFICVVGNINAQSVLIVQDQVGAEKLLG